jgi:hypothetical protein
MKLEVVSSDTTREIVPYKVSPDKVKELAIGTKNVSRLFVRSSISGKLYVVDAPPELVEEFEVIETRKAVDSGAEFPIRDTR